MFSLQADASAQWMDYHTMYDVITHSALVKSANFLTNNIHTHLPHFPGNNVVTGDAQMQKGSRESYALKIIQD